MNETAETPLFDERQWLAPWALTLVCATPLFVLVPLALSLPREATAGLVTATAITATASLAAVLLLGNMHTRVDCRGLAVSFGICGWIRFRFPKGELTSARARRYRPLAEFGGWGIRGFGDRRALNMRGNEGVEIHYRRDGRPATVLVGSQRFHELEHALRLLAVPGQAPEAE